MENNYTCPFCGQGVLVSEDCPEELREHSAKMNCSCPEARSYQKQQMRISAVEDYINAYFSYGKSQEDRNKINLFMSAATAVVHHNVDNTVIKSGKTSFKIYLDGEGYLCIQKTFKDVSEEEF